MNNIIEILLSLPIVLIALSVHETAHGYAAYKLGDGTARNLGRLTLNPIKHFDPFGFICMLLFKIGWAKPVPINARNFRNPRRDMALTAAAGPVSNLMLALLFGALLRIEFIFADKFFAEDTLNALYVINGMSADLSQGYKMMAVLAFILYLGVILNISLAVFNLIPVPPFDGSRIFYVFLPPNLYFKVMKYERYIMLAILLLLVFTSFISTLLSAATGGLADLVLRIFGFSRTDGVIGLYDRLWIMLNYISKVLI